VVKAHHIKSKKASKNPVGATHRILIGNAEADVSTMIHFKKKEVWWKLALLWV
jgi:hypothetical protein